MFPKLLPGVGVGLPRAEEAKDAPIDGTVLRIARGQAGAKIVGVRLPAGGSTMRRRGMNRWRGSFGT